MARLLIFLMFVAVVISSSLALKTCSESPSPRSAITNVDGSALVALRDGSTMMAARGTVGRDLVDWLAVREPGSKMFELGGQEFVGRTAEPTAESVGRVSRLIAMLRANADVRVMIVGHTDPSGDVAADHALGFERADRLARLLREGGVSKSRISTDSKGAESPIAPNDSPEGRAKNQRVSLMLSRED